MFDPGLMGKGERGEVSASEPRRELTLRLAVALVQDGATAVTLVTPREPGVVWSARAAARAAGVAVLAEQVAGATITLRFSGDTEPAKPFRGEGAPSTRASARRSSRPWGRLLTWRRIRTTDSPSQSH